MFFWFAGLPSQKCVCPSMTKISSPLAVLYMAFAPAPVVRADYDEARLRRSRIAWPAPRPAMTSFAVTSDDVFHHLVHVAEQHDGVVVGHDHAAVMRRGRYLEEMRGHDAAQFLRNLIHLEFHLPVAVDADHRRHVRHPDMIVATHDVGDRARLDAIVHRDPALMRNRILECDVLHRFEDIVVLVQHVCLLRGWVKGARLGYEARLAGTFKPSSVAIPLMRFFACARPSVNVATLTRGW